MNKRCTTCKYAAYCLSHGFSALLDLLAEHYSVPRSGEPPHHVIQRWEDARFIILLQDIPEGCPATKLKGEK